MKIICALSSKSSYERIKNEIFIPEVEWQLEPLLDRIRTTLSTDYIELAIVDHSIEGFDEIVELFELKNVKILIFRGVFNDVIDDAKRKINEILKEEEEEERAYLNEVGESSDSISPLKVMVKEVIRTERVEIPVIQNIANNAIAIVNLSERAGSTFVATNLARSISKRETHVTLYESPIGKMDLYYTMGFYNYNKSFYSYREALSNQQKIEVNKFPSLYGVSLGINDPATEGVQLEERDILRLMAATKGLVIYDIGWDYSGHMFELLKACSLILVVVDPIGSQIARNEERLNELEVLRNNGGQDIRFVFNKWSNAINKDQFEKGFDLKSFLTIPFMEPGHIYQMYYRKTFKYLIDDAEVGEEIDEAFHPLLQDFLPEDKLHLTRSKKNKSIRNLFTLRH